MFSNSNLRPVVMAPSYTNGSCEPLKPRSKHTIYLIRHGEKPTIYKDGGDRTGLSEEGLERAEGLVKVFGKDSKYNIGHIIAQNYKKDGSRKRPYDTIHPLSKDLDVRVDTSIQRDNTRRIAEAALEWKGEGNVLICWEHHKLKDIVKKLGVAGTLSYPDNRYDVIWTVRTPYDNLHSWTSEGIEGLDEENMDP